MSLKEVRERCAKGRFFNYVGYVRAGIFVPPSVLLTWVFINLGWSGNAVSWLSGGIALLGGCLIASQDKYMVLVGSCCYAVFYLLDYVDGSVARIRGAAGIGGQYTDWLMHVVSSLSIFGGVAIGALGQDTNVSRLYLIPFALLMLLAASLQLARYSLGWWTICMYWQQNRVKQLENGVVDALPGELAQDDSNRGGIGELGARGRSFMFRAVRGVIFRIFHEDYAIIILPIMALCQLILAPIYPALWPDFRVILTILGGSFYFSLVVHDILEIVRQRKLDRAYVRLFYSHEAPKLPSEHFFY